MNSPKPPDRPAPDSDDTSLYGSDDEDTGPLQAYRPPPAAEPDFGVTQDNWARRFETPLSVTPRQVQRQRNMKPLAVGAAVVGAVAVVGGLIFWLTRPSHDVAAQPPDSGEPTTSTPPEPTTVSEDDARLLRQLPKGYAADACESVPAPENVLSQVHCKQNNDPGGPSSATYSLTGDKASLQGVFDDAIAAATRVNCPGNIQSPGPWRRNATPDRVSGQLFCGLLDGQPTVVWTDEAKMTVSAVRAGPSGPTFPQLYAWWSSHS